MADTEDVLSPEEMEAYAAAAASPTPAGPQPAAEQPQPAADTDTLSPEEMAAYAAAAEAPSAAPAYGALEPGNIDLTKRPRVENADGTISTVRSIGVNFDGREYLIPTVSNDGRVMGDDEAIGEFQRTGQHLGVYATPEASTAAAEAIHADQERMYADPPAAEEQPAPEEPAMVRVVAPDGTRGSIPADQARRALSTEGYTLLTPEMEAEEAAQARYGDGTGQAIAGVQGFGRGATLGISDYLARVGAGIAGADVGGRWLGENVPVVSGPGMDAPLVEQGSYDEQAADQAARDIEGYREANKATAIVSEIGGAIAPVVLSGGASTGAAALRLTPAGALGRLGLTMSEHLAAKAATAVGRIGATALVAGGEGAFENAARVVTEEITRSGIDAEAMDRTAERMAPALWEGFAYGAALGAGAGAIGEGITKLRSRRAAAAEADGLAAAADDAAIPEIDTGPDVPPPESVRPREEISADLDAARVRLEEAEINGRPLGTGEAANDVARLLSEQDAAEMARLQLTTDSQYEAVLKLDPSPEVLSIIERIDQSLNVARNAKDLELKFQDAASALEEGITTSTDDLLRFEKNVFDMHANRSNKPRVYRAMLAQDGVEWNQARMDKIAERVDGMERELDNYLDSTAHTPFSPQQIGSFKAGKKALQEVRARLTGLRSVKGAPAHGPIAPASGTIDDVADVVNMLDHFKSYLGGFAAEATRKPTTVNATFQRLYMLLRADLQDARLVGPALADFQTATNAAITRNIRKGKLFEKLVGREGSSEAGGQFNFGDVPELDPDKVLANVVRRLGDPQGRKNVRDFVAGLTSRVEYMETLAKHYPMPPEALAEIAQARRMLTSTNAQLRAAKELAVKAAEAKRLASQTHVLDAVIQGVRGIPYAGAAFASLIGTASSAARGLSGTLVSLGKGAASQEVRLAKAARSTMRNLVEPTPAQVARPALKAVSGEPVHLVGLGMTSNAVQRAIEEAKALQSADSDESRSLDQQLAAVRDESPELAGALEAKIRGTADFIASKVPQVDQADPFRRNKALIDPISERSVARYVAAARDPMGALERLGSNAGTKEDRETMRALYPALYQRFVRQVQAEIKETKAVPSPAQRQALHFATGIAMSREQGPQDLARRASARAASGAEPPEPTSDALKPMVPPSKASHEFTADQHFASRSDAVTSGAD